VHIGQRGTNFTRARRCSGALGGLMSVTGHIDGELAGRAPFERRLINPKTARALGLNACPVLLGRAAEAISGRSQRTDRA